ncbi:trypsin-like serine protease [Confluentibacter sediminis]|uniref:trypsin-like serine protease n=1 Tax=Confluentibacter sediminis TaxID=2219045 RepID=UPI000DAEC872|nr:trypsin-like serine protease [Confluentibacter sediminis]
MYSLSRKIYAFFTIFIGLLFFTSGIMRHDVNEAEYLKLGSLKQFESVGEVIKDSTNKTEGSCVLIDKKFVLSAAHVFAEFETTPDTIKMNGQKIVVNLPSKAKLADISKFYLNFNNQKYKIKSVVLHPNYSENFKNGGYDIALIQLKEEIKNVIPATLNKSLNELNENVVGVGYGMSGVANKPNELSLQHKKIGGENVIDSIGGLKIKNLHTILYCDFDSSEDPSLNLMGSALPRPLEYLPVAGDSGGGLFRQDGNSWNLIGIVHGGKIDLNHLKKNGYYGTLMGWTRVSVFNDWITKTMDEKRK